MGYSIIEGIIRQTTGNAMKKFEVLKNGKPTGVIGDIELVVHVIRHLEAMMDRETEHSPYTIGKA